jgi:hypothetical protein
VLGRTFIGNRCLSARLTLYLTRTASTGTARNKGDLPKMGTRWLGSRFAYENKRVESFAWTEFTATRPANFFVEDAWSCAWLSMRA